MNLEHPRDTARTGQSAALDWAIRFLPDYFSDQPADFHRELMADLEGENNRLIARVAPRGHAKSTCAALAYPLWCICAQRKRNIVIVTHESSLATQFVRDIRHELETNDEILDEYGDLCVAAEEAGTEEQDDARSKKRGGARSKKSNAKQTKTKKRTAKRRRKWAEGFFTTGTGITVQAKGSGGSLRGVRVGPQRPDLIICDDIEKDELVATAEGRRKLEHWLRRVVMPALAPDGQLLILGSIIHHDSLLANLRDRRRFPRWDYRVYRALEAVRGDDGEFHRIALWPSRWPVHKLDEERERVGTLAFEQEYQANPIDDSLRIFRPEWLRRYDDSELVEENLLTLMTVDPATGVSGGDYFAIWVGSVDRDTGVIYTRVLTIERIGIVRQVKRIIAVFEQWQPARVGIETVAYQVALKEVLEEESRKRGLYIPVVGIQTTANKRARIEGSSVFYENGTFRLPAELEEEIEQQFLHFPKARHDDAPDVCAMGIELARAFRSSGALDAETGSRDTPARGDGW